MELVTDPKLLIAPDGRTETQTRLRRGAVNPLTLGGPDTDGLLFGNLLQFAIENGHRNS